MMVICSGNKVEVVEFDSPRERVEQQQMRKRGGWRSFFGKGTQPKYGSGEKYRRRGWKEIIPAEITANPGPDGNAPVAVKTAVQEMTPRSKTNRVGVQEEDNTAKGDAAPVSLAKQVKNRVMRGFQRLFSRGRQGPAPPVEASDAEKIGPSGDDPNPAKDTDESKRVQLRNERNEEPNVFDGTGSYVSAGAKISFSSIKLSPKPSLLGDKKQEEESGHAKGEPGAKSRFPEPLLVVNRQFVPDMKVESRKIKVRGNNMEVTVRCIMVKEAPGCTNLLAKHGEAAIKSIPEATVPPPTAPIAKDEKSELVVEDIENFDDVK